MYAVGDVTSVGTPKAGVFAEGQAAVVAAQLVARARGEASGTTYDGRGICYLEFGADQVAKVDVTFLSGQAPVGTLAGPVHRARPRQGGLRGRADQALVRAGLDAVVSAESHRAADAGRAGCSGSAAKIRS